MNASALQPIAQLAIVGTGNVAHVLGRSFHAAGIRISFVCGRNEKEGRALANSLEATFTTQTSELTGSDAVLLAVSDDAIREVSVALPLEIGTRIHCSGSRPLEDLHGAGGVLWPLESMRAEAPWSVDAPIIIEATSDGQAIRLEQLALTISSHVVTVGIGARVEAHLAAVLAGNMTNYFLGKATELAESAGVPWIHYEALIRTTLERGVRGESADRQTGPAARKDMQVVENHRAILAKKDPVLAKIYDAISRDIARESNPST